MADRMLKIDEVFSLIGFGRTYVYRHIKQGKFPKPVKFGKNSRWRLSDIEQWISEHQTQ